MTMEKLICFLIATAGIYVWIHLMARAIVWAYKIINRMLVYRNSKRMEGK
jgi:hypothetical protein